MNRHIWRAIFLSAGLAGGAACGGSSNNPNAMDCTLCEGLLLQDSTAAAFMALSCTDDGTGGPTFNCSCTLDGSSEVAMPFVYERQGAWICEG